LNYKKAYFILFNAITSALFELDKQKEKTPEIIISFFNLRYHKAQPRG